MVGEGVMRFKGLLLVLISASLVAGCQPKPKEPAPVDGARIAAAEGNGEWLSYGRT
jgi:hypothetical protein